MMKKAFLRASWLNLVLLNYEIPQEVLRPYLPSGTELDLWNGICYASLVGFKFADTRVLGIKVPCHVNFEEVNLRFYVRHRHEGQWKRGVVFIKEIVPKAAITFVANTMYKEHYETMPMKHVWHKEQGMMDVQYFWKYAGAWNHIKVKAEEQARPLEEGSEADFITNHFWGYTRSTDDETLEYEVSHPSWNIHKVLSFEVSCDVESLYGPAFVPYLKAAPRSVFLAEGSEISVGNKSKIRVS